MQRMSTAGAVGLAGSCGRAGRSARGCPASNCTCQDLVGGGLGGVQRRVILAVGLAHVLQLRVARVRHLRSGRMTPEMQCQLQDVDADRPLGFGARAWEIHWQRRSLQLKIENCDLVLLRTSLRLTSYSCRMLSTSVMRPWPTHATSLFYCARPLDVKAACTSSRARLACTPPGHVLPAVCDCDVQQRSAAQRSRAASSQLSRPLRLLL